MSSIGSLSFACTESIGSRRSRMALGLAIAVAILHIFLVWGYTGFWGDAGRWRHEVERFAHGETLYRDFVWSYPPMALWLLGWTERIFGDSVNVTFAAGAFLTLLISVIYWRYCSALLKPIATVAIVAPLGILLAIGFAQIGGDPLPSGMYTPAAPIG